MLLNLPASGLILSVDLVNTEMNCFKSIVALDLASVTFQCCYTNIVLSFSFCITPNVLYCSCDSYGVRPFNGVGMRGSPFFKIILELILNRGQ